MSQGWGRLFIFSRSWNGPYSFRPTATLGTRMLNVSRFPAELKFPMALCTASCLIIFPRNCFVWCWCSHLFFGSVFYWSDFSVLSFLFWPHNCVWREILVDNIWLYYVFQICSSNLCLNWCDRLLLCLIIVIFGFVSQILFTFYLPPLRFNSFSGFFFFVDISSMLF